MCLVEVDVHDCCCYFSLGRLFAVYLRSNTFFIYWVFSCGVRFASSEFFVLVLFTAWFFMGFLCWIEVVCGCVSFVFFLTGQTLCRVIEVQYVL